MRYTKSTHVYSKTCLVEINSSYILFHFSAYQYLTLEKWRALLLVVLNFIIIYRQKYHEYTSSMSTTFLIKY